MKSHFKLIIFAIIVLIIVQAFFSFSPIKNIISTLSPTDYVEKEILFKEYVSSSTPYTLNIYTDVAEKDFPYSEENQLLKNVVNYTPDKVSTFIKPNVGYEVNKIKEYTNTTTNKIAVLIDKEGYILSAFPFPLDKQLILSNLINLSNIK